MPTGFFSRQDSVPLSQVEYDNALRCRDWVANLMANRESYIHEKRLDADVHLPRGCWEQDDKVIYRLYRAIRDGGYEQINNLRMYTQVFTGFPLDHFAETARHPDNFVSLYRHVTSCLHPELHITPPSRFGEVGWLVDEKIVNHDTYVYLERLILLAESRKFGELRAAKQPRVLEIGGGFGGLAYYVKKLVPQARYYIVDIPESLVFSSIYLTTLYPDNRNVLLTPDNLDDLKIEEPGFTFVPNYLFGECLAAGVKLDLAINTLSLSEMTEKQVRHYAEGLKKLLGGMGAFFEQNHDNRVLGYVDAKAMIRDYFSRCLPLMSPVLYSTQGNAHLWTNSPACAESDNWNWRQIPPRYRRHLPFNWRHYVGQKLPLWALRPLLWLSRRMPK